MKKATIILSFLCCFLSAFAQSSNQWVGWKDISPKIPGTFTQVNPEFMSATNRFLRKDSILNYISIYDDWHAAKLSNKAMNQFIAYGDLVAVTPLGCSTAWDSLTLDQSLNASQVAYFNVGSNSGTITCTYTNLSVSGNGYGRVNAYYGGQLLARSTYSNTSGSFSIPYTYNPSYGQYMRIVIDSAGLHPQPWYNISMSCIYGPAILTFTYSKTSADITVNVSTALQSSSAIDVTNVTFNGYNNNTCTVANGTATLNGTSSLAGQSSGTYNLLTTNTIGGTATYGHMVNSVTVNGTVYTNGSVLTIGGQQLTIDVSNLSCGTIPN